MSVDELMEEDNAFEAECGPRGTRGTLMRKEIRTHEVYGGRCS